MKIRILILMILGIVVFRGTCTAEVGVPVVVKGTILDIYTGKPCELAMMFTDESGEKFKIYPNSSTGKYEQVLKSGMNYTVTFIAYDILRDPQALNIEFSEEYHEYSFDFKVRRMTPGLEMFNSEVFVSGKANLTADGEKLLQTIAKGMKFSRGAKLDLFVGGASQSLINDRISTIQKIKEIASLKSRIAFASDSRKGDEQKLRVVVREISDPLKKN